MGKTEILPVFTKTENRVESCYICACLELTHCTTPVNKNMDYVLYCSTSSK